MKTVWKSSCALLIVALSMPLFVHAELEEIVVTAERRSEDVQSVPIAVSAFSADSMENLGIDSAIDLGAAVPNLRTQQITGGVGAVQISMRGANVQIPGLNTSESPVGIYTDGIYRGRLAAANLEYLDVERIEVLRGPQGTLYGRNTLAGAVNVISRTPDDESWATLKAGYGSWDTVDLGGSIGGPLQEGSMAGSLAVQFSERGEGFIENPILGDRGAYENYAARGKLHFYGNDKYDLTLSAFIENSDNDGYNGIPYDATGSAPLAGFYTNLTPNPDSNASETEVTGIAADLTVDLSDNVALRSITALQAFEDAFAMDLAGVGFVGVDASSEMDQLTQEFQLLGTAADGRLDWLAGVYFMNEEGEQQYGIADFFFVEDTTSETNSMSFFAEGTYAINDKLAITAGIRYTEDDKEFTYDLQSFAPDSFALDETFSSTTPKLGIDYQLNEDVLLYASVSSGFQAGGFQTLTFGNAAVAREFYKPMEVLSYEAGVKADFCENTVRMNANVFLAAYEELQGTVPLNGGFPQLNVGDVDVTGLELELTVLPTDNLTLYLTAGYADDDVNSNVLPPQIALSSLPEISARIGFNYESPIGAGDLALKVGADYEYTDEYFAALDNALLVPDYNRTGAYIGIGDQSDSWEVRLSGKNLTDEDTIVSGLGFPSIRTILPPQSWKLTVKYDF